MASPLVVTPAVPLELIRTRQGQPSSDNKYREVGLVRHPDGILLRFTERIETGRISAGIFRFFRDQQDERESVYFAAHHIDAAHRLLDVADQHMLILESEALARLAGQRASGRR